MTPGAGAGAAAGAIIGGAATGHVRGAAIGAAAGAAAGALIGAAVEEDQAARYRPPPGGFPYGQFSGRSGLFYSPYTDRLYDLRGVPRAADSLATSTPVSSSESRNRAPAV